jgi:NDP-sugar pyrophosphorylase family protein
MEWPNYIQYPSLFPSFGDEKEGILPSFSNSLPIWQILDPNSSHSLKSQLINALENLKPKVSAESLGVTFDESKGPVIIDSSAIIQPSSHFIGPCYVGPKAQIRHGAYVREFSWICSGAVVGHCSEVKHSILLPGAKAPHFNYVGDSILGAGVNLGAGTKLSNLRNDGGEVHVRLDGQRIGSGLRKFGAILAEGCQLGCNSVTNPGTILGCNSIVWPNVTVTGIYPSDSKHR